MLSAISWRGSCHAIKNIKSTSNINSLSAAVVAAVASLLSRECHPRPRDELGRLFQHFHPLLWSKVSFLLRLSFSIVVTIFNILHWSQLVRWYLSSNIRLEFAFTTILLALIKLIIKWRNDQQWRIDKRIDKRKCAVYGPRVCNEIDATQVGRHLWWCTREPAG